MCLVIAVYRGISTYEYIVQLREKGEKEAREKHVEEGKSESSKTKSTKVCVSPHRDDVSEENRLKRSYLTSPRLCSRSSVLECQARNRGSPGLNPPFAAILKPGHFYSIHDAPVHSAV